MQKYDFFANFAPLMVKLYDNHNHSQFSFDGKRTTVYESAKAAHELGLGGLCFTDHCDFHVPLEKALHEDRVSEIFDVKPQQEEIERVRTLIPGTEIFKGIEIGLYRSCHNEIRSHLTSHSFDQVIASVHYIDDTDPYWGNYYEYKDWKEAYGHYLETILEEITWLQDFDILGHYDYVARYAPYPKTSILYRDFSDLFDAILTFLAQEGKALEINTKTYQDFSGRRPEQDKNILLRYKELGGELLSLGSDSHDPFNVGHNFQEWPEYFKSLGFKYTAHFKDRGLVMTRI